MSELIDLPYTGRGGEFNSVDNAPYKEGNEAVLSCAEGYILPDEYTSTVIIEDGKLVWEPDEINCQPASYLLQLPKTNRSGRFYPVDHNITPPYHINDEMELRCNSGYYHPNLHTSKVVLKQGKLVWEPAEINCIGVTDMSQLPKTGPGGIFACNFPPPYQIKDKAFLICDSGYKTPSRNFSRVLIRYRNRANIKMVWKPPEIDCIPVDPSEQISNFPLFVSILSVYGLIALLICILFRIKRL